jgi:hypothetical protein
MAHRTVRCTTGHCPVRQPRHPTVRVRPLELLSSGTPNSPVVHRTSPIDCPVRRLAHALTSARTVAHLMSSADDRWREVVVAPLAHWTVRCRVGQNTRGSLARSVHGQLGSARLGSARLNFFHELS